MVDQEAESFGPEEWQEDSLKAGFIEQNVQRETSPFHCPESRASLPRRLWGYGV